MTEFDLGPFLRREERIDGCEHEAIRERWLFGRDLLSQRKGKKLPSGLLARLAEATGKSRTELQYRVQFAERYPTEDALSNALDNYASWHEVVNTALARDQQPHAETPPLPVGKFSTIVADPPWNVKTPPTQFGGSGAAQALDYPTMGVDEIAGLDIKEHAGDGAHLYLWTINAYVENAYAIARAWGFEPSTLLVWCKAPHGIGQGGAYVLTTEYILFARRGTLTASERIDRTWFEWPRGAHSVKPEEFYGQVERVSPGPYLELFARRPRPRWEVWGNEIRDEQRAA